jgi:hypothetical protein
MIRFEISARLALMVKATSTFFTSTPLWFVFLVLMSTPSKGSQPPDLWILRWEFTNQVTIDPKGTGVEPKGIYSKSVLLPFSRPCYLFIAYGARLSPGEKAPTTPISVQYELVRGTICDYAGGAVHCREVLSNDLISITQKHLIGPLSEIAGSFIANPNQGWRDASQDWANYTASGVLGIRVRRSDTNEVLSTTNGQSTLTVPHQ